MAVDFDKRAVPGPAVALIASAAQFMVVLDGTIVNVALPAIRQDLGLGDAGQQWVITAYLLVFGGLLLLGGRAADIVGRRRIFLAGLAVFSVASLLGGFAPTGGLLIAARALQGVGAAMLAPAPMGLIAATYPEGAARVRAIGMWAATASAAGTAGVVLGGVLTQVGDWRWVMFVNVPIGAVLIGAALRLLPADEPTARPSAADLDLPGAMTVTGGLALLLYAISGVSSAGWASVRTLLPLAAAIVLLTAFAMIETRARRPLLRPGLLRIRGVFVGNSAMFLAGALTNCVVFFLALYLQDAHGYDPLRGGLAMVPIAVATALASLLARRIMTRIGARATLVTGALTMAAGLLWMSRFTADGTYPVQVLGPEILAGLGLGLFVMPITTAAVTGVPRADTGVAAALINASRQLGGSAGVALLATVAGTVTAYAAGPRPVVLSSGYSVALMVTAGMALLTTAVAVVLPKATS